MAVVVVDRIGRRILLIASGVMMSITIFGLGAYFYLVEKEKSIEMGRDDLAGPSSNAVLI